MGWKQCVTIFSGDAKGIEETFGDLHFAFAAPDDMALFFRVSPDMKQTIYLLTPAAAQYAGALSGHWLESTDHDRFEWSLAVGTDDPWTTFRLKQPRAAQPPIRDARVPSQPAKPNSNRDFPGLTEEVVSADGVNLKS